MATWGGAQRLFGVTTRGWDFPTLDDQTPQSTDAPALLPPRNRWLAVAVVGIVVVGLAVVTVGVAFQRQAPLEVVGDAPVTPAEVVAGPETVIVHVSGAVNAPGIVELPLSSRVIDAIEAAGGSSLDAEVGHINLARIVTDGEHIVVPVEGQHLGTPNGTDAPGPISLSRSTVSQLQELPGVGPALAQRIIDWRDEHGPFQAIDDVLAVSGIGPATVEKFRDHVVP